MFSADAPGVVEVAIGQYDNLEFAINAPVPEPASLGLLGFGVLGLALASRRRRSV